jgi:hypothetical protein
VQRHVGAPAGVIQLTAAVICGGNVAVFINFDPDVSLHRNQEQHAGCGQK